MEVISARNKNAQQVAMSQEVPPYMEKTNESAPAAMQKGYSNFIANKNQPQSQDNEREMTITEEEEKEQLNGDEEQIVNTAQQLSLKKQKSH